MLCHHSSHTKKKVQNPKAHSHPSHEPAQWLAGQETASFTTEQALRLKQTPALWWSQPGHQPFWCWFCPPGMAYSLRHQGLKAQRVGFPAGLLSKSSKAEGWVGEGSTSWNPRSWHFASWSGLFWQRWKSHPVLFYSHPLHPKNSITLSEASVGQNKCERLVHPSTACLISSFCVQPSRSHSQNKSRFYDSKKTKLFLIKDNFK